MTQVSQPTRTASKRKRSFHTLLVFRCPTDLSERLADFAADQHSNISAVIRRLVEAGLNDQS